MSMMSRINFNRSFGRATSSVVVGLALGFTLAPALYRQINQPSTQLSFETPAYAYSSLGNGYDKGHPANMNNSDEVENPFPNKLTPEMVASAANPTKTVKDNLAIYAELILKDGTAVPIQDDINGSHLPRRDLFTYYKDQVVGYNEYIAINPVQSNKIGYIVFTPGNYVYDKWTPGSTDLVGQSFDKLPVTKLTHNGKDIDKNNLFWYFSHIPTTQYFEVNYAIPEGTTQIWYDTSVWGIIDYGAPGYNWINFFYTWQPVTATYHYVDESAYRQVAGLDATTEIPERSAGEAAWSIKPYSTLDIADLSDTTVVHQAYQMRDDNSKPSITPLLNADDAKPNDKYMQIVNNDEGVPVRTKDFVPTHSELISKQIKGYVYLDDDIDTAPHPESEHANDASTDEGAGNHYMSIAKDSAGNVYRDKHYYLIYRALPTALNATVLHEGSQEPVAGVSYDLYRVEGDKNILVSQGLTSGEDGTFGLANTAEPTYAELEALAKNKDAYDGLTHSFTDTTGTYLQAGSYMLIPTAAPKGIVAQNLKFEVSPLEITGEGTEEDPYVAHAQYVKLAVSDAPAPEPEPTDSELEPTEESNAAESPDDEVSIPETSEGTLTQLAILMSSTGLSTLAASALTRFKSKHQK